MPLAIIELLTPVSEVMPSMFSTHTNEVEIIIGLLMTCWKMVPLRGLCLHFPQSLWALNLSAVSCATNWASLCFWLDRPAIACSLQTFPCLMFSEAAVTGLIPMREMKPASLLFCAFKKFNRGQKLNKAKAAVLCAWPWPEAHKLTQTNPFICFNMICVNKTQCTCRVFPRTNLRFLRRD